MLTELVKQELNQDQPTALHNALKNHVCTLVDMSRQHMKSYYPIWDNAQSAYKAFQNLDKDDKKAIERNEPTKQKIPAVYAKVQTFKAFVLSLYFQRPRFYELDAQGMEDEDYKELAEKLIDRDLKLNGWFNTLNKWAGNLGKFGLGILKHSWEEEFAYFTEEVTETPFTMFGVPFGKGKTTNKVTKVPKKLGNKVVCLSPYDFLPDVRLPLTKFAEGEFCADETEMSLNDLRQKEAEGICAGIKHIQPLSSTRCQWRQNNGATRRSKINYNRPEMTSNMVRITEVQIKIIPSKFKLADGTNLGPESYPVKYLIWIANDAHIVRLSSMSYLHDSFTWDVAQYDEDDEAFLSTSLSEIVSPLQDISDWFFNTRVANVAQNLEDKLIVDPVGVDMDSLKKRGRIILLKKGASRAGVDKFVKQLDVRDVTARHMDDSAQVGAIINSVSGLSENLSGNYHSGRRSAAESRVVTQGASARPKLIAQCAWHACLAPLGQKLLTNLRQGLPPELIVKYAGSQWAAEDKLPAIQAFTSTVEDLVSSCDLFVYDGTLDTEKNYLAQQLMELFQQMIQLGPTGLLNLELSPKLLIEKVYELLGVGDLRQFSLAKDPQTLQNIVQQIAQQMAMQMVEQMQAQQPPAAIDNGPA